MQAENALHLRRLTLHQKRTDTHTHREQVQMRREVTETKAHTALTRKIQNRRGRFSLLSADCRASCEVHNWQHR